MKITIKLFTFVLLLNASCIFAAEECGRITKVVSRGERSQRFFLDRVGRNSKVYLASRKSRLKMELIKNAALKKKPVCLVKHHAFNLDLVHTLDDIDMVVIEL